MLGAMRRHSKSFIVYLLFAMIIVVFVFTFNTGAGNQGGCTAPESPAYAKVEGNLITRDNLVTGMGLRHLLMGTPEGMRFTQAAVTDLAALAGREGLDDLTPQQVDAYMQLLEMVYLASEEARRLGFQVGEKELAKAMYPDQYYEEEEVEGEDGITTNKKVFKEKEFNNWVVYGLHSSPQEYEKFVTRILLAFKLQSFMNGVIKVEPMESELDARAKGTKVDIEYVEFRPEFFRTEVNSSEEESKKFAEGKDDLIKAYYDSHPMEFHADPAVTFAGIYVAGVKVPEPKRGEEPVEVLPTPEQMEQAKGKIQDMRDRIEGKKDLFEGGKMPLAIDPAAGSVQIDSKDLAFPEVPLQRFKEVAKRESEHQESKDRSGLFFGWKSEAELKADPFGDKVAADLVGAKKDAIVGPLEGKAGYWLFYVQDAKEKKDLSLADARLDIAGRLLQEEKAPEFANERAAHFLTMLQQAEEKDMEKVLEEFKKPATEGADENIFMNLMQVRKSGKFHLATSGYSIPGIGKYQELFEILFKTAKAGEVLDKVYVHPESKRAFVIKVAETVMPDEKIDEADLERSEETLAFERSQFYFAAWLQNIRQRALETGDLERTQELQDFLAHLQIQLQEAEQRAAKKAAKQAGGVPIAVPPPAQ